MRLPTVLFAALLTTAACGSDGSRSTDGPAPAGGPTSTAPSGGCSAAGLDPVEPQEGLAPAVATRRADIAEAARACDFAELAELAGDRFTYSFGSDGDAEGFWRRQEAAGDDPLRHLVEVLRMPHATRTVGGTPRHVWPSAFAYESWDAVPRQDRDALRPLYDEEQQASFERFGAYVGYRVGIAEDGEWLFFVAGD